VVAINPLNGQGFTPGREAIRAAQRHSWGVTSLGETVLEHRLCAFLFADVKGFGGLRETHMPLFVESIVKMTAAAVGGSGVKPLVVNTWGDGLLVVTGSPAEAAEIGLSLIESTRPKSGRRSRFNFRVGLHCGPAFFVADDPITGRPNVYGADVNLAARIEPLVRPGQVWASRSFVVLAAATNAAGLRFTELGWFELPKDSGRLLLSRVRRGDAGAASKSSAPVNDGHAATAPTPALHSRPPDTGAPPRPPGSSAPTRRSTRRSSAR
jgi:class 3 adenylate cyclase